MLVSDVSSPRLLAKVVLLVGDSSPSEDRWDLVFGETVFEEAES